MLGEPSDWAKCEVEYGDKAMESCNQAIKSQNYKGYQLVALYYNRARHHEAAGQFEKAIADYTEASQIDVTGATFSDDSYMRGSSIQHRALLFEEIGEYDRAISDWNERIREDANPYYFKERARVYVKKGDYNRAIADYTTAITKAPPDGLVILDAYLGRANAYQRKGDRRRAIADYRKVVAIAKRDDTPATKEAKAKAQAALKELRRAR